MADDATGNTEVHLIQPDGGGARCLTCRVAAIPKGFVGQPAWHPDGEHLVLQVENRRSEHRHYNHPSWGVDNDLWLVRRDGSGARRIWATAAGHAALHPHFDRAGRLLVFAERVPTGRKLPPRLRRFGPGGENQWAGWRLHVAEVDVARGGEDVLSRHRVLAPNGPGFYETHGFTSDGRIVYSFTPGGQAYVDDCYSARLDGSDVRNLTQGPGTWEEHAQYSPDGTRLAFISSRLFPSLRFPGTRPRDLRTELFLRDGDGVARPITGMNARLGGDIVVSDFDWDGSGQRLVFQVARLGDRVKPELWLLDLTIPSPSTPPPPSPPR